MNGRLRASTWDGSSGRMPGEADDVAGTLDRAACARTDSVGGREVEKLAQGSSDIASRSVGRPQPVDQFQPGGPGAAPPFRAAEDIFLAAVERDPRGRRGAMRALADTRALEPAVAGSRRASSATTSGAASRTRTTTSSAAETSSSAPSIGPQPPRRRRFRLRFPRGSATTASRAR